MSYPRQGKALLPSALRGLLGQITLTPSEAEATGLAPGTRLDEIGPIVWTILSSQQINALAGIVITHLRQRHLDLLGDETPIFVSEPAAAELQLSIRAYNALVWGDLVEDGRLRPTTVRELAQVRNLGAMSVLDVLNAIDGEVPPSTPASSELKTAAADASPVEDLHVAVEVQEAAERLAARPWAHDVRRGDPRLGDRLNSLSRSGETAAAAADELAARRLNPADAALVAQGIYDFIAEVDQLGKLTLEEELRDVVRMVVASRHIDTAIDRFGLKGNPPMTLDEAGRRATVTRERVRQVTNKLPERLAGAYAPTLDRVLERVHELAPAPGQEVFARLRAEGLTTNEWSALALESAARVLGRELLISHDRRHDIFTKGSELPAFDALKKAAGRLVEHWGVTTVEDVAAEAGVAFDGDEARESLIVLLSQLPGLYWLDDEHRWLWMSGKRNRLLNQVEKIMAVAGSIDLGELRDGVGRHHRMNGFRPPRDVLAGLCAVCGGYKVEDGRVIGGPDLPDWQDLLGEVERTIADVLFEEGPVMRREDLERSVVARGIARNSFYVYLTYSPILRRFAPGVFGLRGAPVTAAQVQALIPPRIRTQVLKDHGYTAAGELWAVYKISQSVAASGVVSPSSAMRSVAKGRYELYTDDDRPAGTLVVANSIWGLSPFFRRWGIEPGDHVAIVIDTKARRATVSAGDEDLLLRFQTGE